LRFALFDVIPDLIQPSQPEAAAFSEVGSGIQINSTNPLLPAFPPATPEATPALQAKRCGRAQALAGAARE